MTSVPAETVEFERLVLPFLDDAYTLARYLMRDEHDTQDIVQESFLRALRYYGRHEIENPRAWLLTIVRRTCYAWRTGQRGELLSDPFDETLHSVQDASADPAAQVIAACTREQVLAALDSLPHEFREVMILRELQELTYREISEVIDAPIGTVMSRLARGRHRLKALLGGETRRP